MREFNIPDLTAEDEKLHTRGTKLAKVARSSRHTLDIMLTVLNEASAGFPILRPVAGSALLALETVQKMDSKHSLVAQVLVDIVETSYVVTLALQRSDQGQEQIVEERISRSIQSLDEKLRDIHQKLGKLLKPRAGIFSLITRVMGDRKPSNLHKSLKTERARLGPLISTLTYCGIRCRLPVDHDDLRQYAEEQTTLQLQTWRSLQPGSPGPDAFVKNQVDSMTAKNVRGNPVGTRRGAVNGTGFQGSNAPHHIPRGDIRHRTNIGMVANYNSGEVHGTVNQGCNFFVTGHRSQQPVAHAEW
ncbi:hypothetical protein MD484_g5487, partial [Candolleomyces efflorescens]